MHWHTLGEQKKKKRKILQKIVLKKYFCVPKASSENSHGLTPFHFLKMFRKSIRQTHHGCDPLLVAEPRGDTVCAEARAPQRREG